MVYILKQKSSVRFTRLQIYSKLIMVLNSKHISSKISLFTKVFIKNKFYSTSIQANGNATNTLSPKLKSHIISTSYGLHLHSQVPCIFVSLSESASEFLVGEYCSIHPPTHFAVPVRSVADDVVF